MTSRQQLITILQNGGLAVIPTDTIYGLVGQALNRQTVERLYRLKKRSPDKPYIILISSYRDLAIFDIVPSAEIKKFLKKYWPGEVSVIFPCPNKKWHYLYRGTGQLAFRLPKSAPLRALLRQTGSLVAPSANPQNLEPAQDIEMAEKYFGTKVDGYYGRKKIIENTPSTLVTFEKDKPRVLRQGKIKIK